MKNKSIIKLLIMIVFICIVKMKIKENNGKNIMWRMRKVIIINRNILIIRIQFSKESLLNKRNHDFVFQFFFFFVFIIKLWELFYGYLKLRIFNKVLNQY
jgi:hypothetical protein